MLTYIPLNIPRNSSAQVLQKKNMYSYKIEILYGQPDFFRIFNVISVYAVNKVVAVGESCSGYGVHVTS